MEPKFRLFCFFFFWLSAPNFGVELWSAKSLELKNSHFFLFPLNVPNFNAKLWSTREKKHLIALQSLAPNFGVPRGKNLSTFQNLTPNIGAPKGFSSFGGLRGKETSQHSKVWHQTLKRQKFLVEFHCSVKARV